MQRYLLFLFSLFFFSFSQLLQARRYKASTGIGFMGNTLSGREEFKPLSFSFDVFVSGLFDLSKKWTTGVTIGYSGPISHQKYIRDEGSSLDPFGFYQPQIAHSQYHQIQIETPFIYRLQLSKRIEFQPFLKVGASLVDGGRATAFGPHIKPGIGIQYTVNPKVSKKYVPRINAVHLEVSYDVKLVYLTGKFGSDKNIEFPLQGTRFLTISFGFSRLFSSGSRGQKKFLTLKEKASPLIASHY